MSDDKTWSMKDMDMIWPEGGASESSPPQALPSELAKAVTKPAYHNSKIKAALLLGGGSCLAVLGTLLFNLTNPKSPEESVATAPDTSNQAASVPNDGWETAAKQSTSDAATAINIPDAKKPNTEDSSTPPATNSTALKTEPKPASSATPPASPVTKVSTVAAPPVVTKPAMVVKTEPKPVVSLPPVAKVSAKPIPYTPTNPPVVTKPAVVVKTEPKPVVSLPPVAKVSAKPIPYTPTNLPVALAPPVKLEPKPVTPPTANSTPAAPPLSWEQASAAGVYGGDPSSVMPPVVGGLGVKDTKQSNYEGAMSPVLLLPAGTNAKGHTLAPYTVGISKDQSDMMPLSIALDEAIELDKGYRLPVGTTVNFIASVRDNGSVIATSKNADIGGVEIQLPEGAISLASDNDGLLMAREISTGAGDLARADVTSAVWGGAAGAGKAILQSGSQTTTNTGLLGTTTQTNNNGSPNIIGGVLDGVFTPLATNGQQRAKEAAENIQKRSKLNTIDVKTRVKLFVNKPIQVQIPVNGQQVGQIADEEESLPPPRLITSNSVSLQTADELPPPPREAQPSVVLPQTAVIQSPLAPPPPLVASPPLPSKLAPSTQTSVVPPLVVKPQASTTPLPLNPPKTRTSKPW